MALTFKTLYLVLWKPVQGDSEFSNYVHACENGYDYRTTVDKARNFGSPTEASEFARVHTSNEDPSELIPVEVEAYYGRNILLEPAVAGKETPRGRSQGHHNGNLHHRRRSDSD